MKRYECSWYQITTVPITTNVVSSNPAHARCVRYNIMWWSFSVTCDRISPVSSTNKTDHHDLTEILLTVALNTINLNQTKSTSIHQIQYFSITMVGVYIHKPYIILGIVPSTVIFLRECRCWRGRACLAGEGTVQLMFIKRCILPHSYWFPEVQWSMSLE